MPDQLTAQPTQADQTDQADQADPGSRGCERGGANHPGALAGAGTPKTRRLLTEPQHRSPRPVRPS